jgi:Domain of unknown function (DUF4157)
VHTDGESAASARDISARAYTSGNHIVFGEGQYQPNTEGGRHLLAHELTHVVQQGGGNSMTVNRETQPQKSFADYFIECMATIGAPAPISLFSSVTTANTTIAAIAKALQLVGGRASTITIGEIWGAALPGAAGAGEIAAAGGGILASAYVGICTGCLADASYRSLSGGDGMGDTLYKWTH